MGAGERKHGVSGFESGARRTVCLHRADGSRDETAGFHAPGDRQRWLGTYRHHRHLRHSRLHTDCREALEALQRGVGGWSTAFEGLDCQTTLRAWVEISWTTDRAVRSRRVPGDTERDSAGKTGPAVQVLRLVRDK